MAACEGPLSTLTPAGSAAAEVARLWWAMLIGSSLITAMVMVMLVLALRNQGQGQPGPAAERRWIRGWGLGFSLTVLTLLLAFGIWIGERIIARNDDTIRVTAHAGQWSWEFVQPGPGGQPVATQGILYVPAGQPFDVEITSADVIHSFWVPRLGGKMDAIPGHANLHRLMAEQPGTFEGLCAEFCGLGHSFMNFQVVAYDPDAPLPPFADAPVQEVRP